MATRFNNQNFNRPAVVPTVQRIKQLTASGTAMERRFEQVMGAKAPRFLASVISVTNGNSYLQKATAESILGAAMVAASLDLEVIPTFGFAAIVPYSDSRTGNTYAQFQLMKRGIIQLAMRTGVFKNVSAGKVYADEYGGEDFYTGELFLNRVAMNDCMRSRDDEQATTIEECKAAGVVGWFAMFELLNGYRKVLYWSIDKIDKHARKYSQAYRSDIRKGTKSSWWRTDFPRMAEKTVLKNLLMNWGPLSSSFVNAAESDQKVFRGDDGGSYLDNPPEEELLDSPDNLTEIEGEPVHDEADEEPAQPSIEEEFNPF